MNGDREPLKIFQDDRDLMLGLMSDALLMAFRRNDLLQNIG